MTSRASASVSAPDAISFRLAKLHDALTAGRSRTSCLRCWSEFIRERDDHRCVDCHSQERLSAHHICRKSFVGMAQFDPGNGITLCHRCHKEVHTGFNGRPDLSLPADAQGGEKLASMERLYSILLDDAIEREVMCEGFYFISDEVLGSLKKMQGYDVATYFPGSCLEQAYLILAEPEQQMRLAIGKANGFVPDNGPLLPGGVMIILDDDGGRDQSPLMRQKYSARWPASDNFDF